MSPRWSGVKAVVIVSCLSSASLFAAPVDYNRGVRPLLSDRCYQCHGPDAAKREAGLRLDLRNDALRPREPGGAAIVQGNPDASPLVKRILSTDPSEVMPPPGTTKPLTRAEQELLRRWIAEGASYQGHWSFQAIQRPPVPQVDRLDLWSARPRNEIDCFIFARLAQDGLSPQLEADRATLIRRVTLDLTGLPPTLEAIDAFTEDTRSDAYERWVERLLDSPRYGERMALEWLDAARFADTHGFHLDSGRDMTRWRDWVIDAYNQNKPFDQFTLEQIAGDLLPDPSLEQRIASGFHRNHMINFEGGAIPEEYHAAYIVDRVNTTATVWLGLTVACAQCHDHKYDPVTQKDFYQLYAFFHNVPEAGLDGSKGNANPFIKVPTAREAAEITSLSTAVHKLQSQWDGSYPELDAAQFDWERSVVNEKWPEWTAIEPLSFRSESDTTLEKLPDGSIRAGGNSPDLDTYIVTGRSSLREMRAIRVEALTDDTLVARGPGRSADGNLVLTDFKLYLGTEATLKDSQLKLKLATADFSQKDYPVSAAIDDDPASGWAIAPEVGRSHAAVFEMVEPIVCSTESILTVMLEFKSASPRHQMGRFRLSATSSSMPHAAQDMAPNVVEALSVLSEDRSEAERKAVREHFRTHVSETGRKLRTQLDGAKKALVEAEEKVRTTMVMQEMEKPRDTFVLTRGEYNKPGEKVEPNVPAFLPPLSIGSPRNRLGLARWLADPRNPLTARVMVNRYWQMYFGAGLVKTAEDFGSQGELPSHPELLDWLAAQFIESGWDVKAMQRKIVTSATYRQSSAVTAQVLERDPDNRLLSRGPRLRLQAEFIRDQALFVSGLLDGRIGGASVSPYQPPGLWEELMSRTDGARWSAQIYQQSHGADLYRRAMYTFWKRTSPPPSLTTLDAPDRETCTVRRPRTNTPLQALILMNDPTYIEAARKLAERILRLASSTDERIAMAFRICTARRPTVAEAQVMRDLLNEQLKAYEQNPRNAEALLGVGEAQWDSSSGAVVLAAWTLLSSAILNLDETVTKG